MLNGHIEEFLIILKFKNRSEDKSLLTDMKHED